MRTAEKWTSLLLMVLVATACRPDPQTEVSMVRSDGADGEMQACSARLALTQTPPAPGARKSTVVFNLNQTDVDPCSVDGYVVGSSETLVIENGGGGTYYIPDVPEGDQDIIVMARGKGAVMGDGVAAAPVDVAGSDLRLTSDARTKFGLRLNRLGLIGGKIMMLPATTRLVPVGHLTGIAHLDGQTHHAGTLVTIPGTRWQTITADDGSYTLADVTVGGHDMFMKKSTYQPLHLDLVAADSGQTTALPDVWLYAE